MKENVLISLAIDELQSIIIDCVNSCLRHSTKIALTHLESEELFSIDEASTFLNLKKPTLYSMVQRREIPVNKRGNRLYFSKSELIDWVKGGRKMTNQELVTKASTVYRKPNKR